MAYNHLDKLRDSPLRPVLRQGELTGNWWIAELRGCLGQADASRYSGAVMIDPDGDGEQLLREFTPSLALIVRDYQRDHALTTDGIVGPQTWASLANEEPDEEPTMPPAGAGADMITAAVREAILRVARYLCDDIQVREEGGNNRGPLVRPILEFADGWETLPWCVAGATACVRLGHALAGQYPPADLPTLSCSKLKSWAAPRGRVTPLARANPADLYVMDIGHVGIIEEIKHLGGDRWLLTLLEFNTGADPSTPEGERDGDGGYRRHRDTSNCPGVAVCVV